MVESDFLFEIFHSRVAFLKFLTLDLINPFMDLFLDETKAEEGGLLRRSIVHILLPVHPLVPVV